MTSSSSPMIVSEQLLSLSKRRQSAILRVMISPFARILCSGLLGVVAGAVPVDDDNGLLADDPGVVAAGQRGDVAGTGDEFGAVVHADGEPSADVVLEVRCLAAVGLGDRLDVVGPAPARLEDEPADLGVAHLENLGAAVGKLAGFVWRVEGLVLGRLH